ncbi:MAG: hypothetical protein CME62_06195 [Halobacteriovoraceae bacterium]|nr:hypothetical protein [Halobacteriovoraceae bacterium]|tara:strand:- start:11038 stop:11541 length:504 start_codon:yes stop_codon:yes gene_type:complete
MKTKPFLFLALIFLSFSSFSKDKQTAVWGKIMANNQLIAGYEYFVTYEEQGKFYAYPIKLKQGSVKNIKSYTGKLVRIVGDIKTETVKLDGQLKQTTVFELASLKPMKLSQLSLGDDNITPTQVEKEGHVPNISKKKSSGGFELSDTAANTTIFAGAALLIGNMLKN